MTRAQALLIAKKINRSQLARDLGITTGAVWQWNDFPVKRVPEIEKATGISRHVLRPDFFGKPGQAQ